MDRWNFWKEVRTNAGKVPALEKRIAALEERSEQKRQCAAPALLDKWGLSIGISNAAAVGILRLHIE
jgi:hypothetical protein